MTKRFKLKPVSDAEMAELHALGRPVSYFRIPPGQFFPIQGTCLPGGRTCLSYVIRDAQRLMEQHLRHSELARQTIARIEAIKRPRKADSQELHIARHDLVSLAKAMDELRTKQGVHAPLVFGE